jgi:4-amino-4-deoxy-L-arabinose transferase-like glycosyltransferase
MDIGALLQVPAPLGLQVPAPLGKRIQPWIVAALLGLLVAQCLLGMRFNAPTSDEQNHIARGYYYLVTGDPQLNMAPPLINLLSALPLLVHKGMIVPTFDRTHVRTFMDQFAGEFVWIYNDAETVINSGRLAIILLSVVFAYFCYRWARDLWGVPAGLLALLLYVLDPNIVAHSQLVTTDLGVAGMMFVATYFLWRFLRWRRNVHLVLAGLLLGLAQASKQSALLLAPVFAVALCIEAFVTRDVTLRGSWPWRQVPVGPYFGGASRPAPLGRRFPRGRWRPGIYFLLAVGLVLMTLAFFSFWACYRFETASLSQAGSAHATVDRFIQDPGLRRLAYRLVEAVRVPFPTYLRGLGWLKRYSVRGAPNFLMGQFSRKGWWYYFLVALAIKTPIPTLILAIAGTYLILRRRLAAKDSGTLGANRREHVLIIAVIGFFASMLFSTVNIGYRHILPVLPFLFVIAGGTITSIPKRWSQVAVVVLCLWLAVGSLRVYPHYLAYFNELVGGPDQGYKYLVDSNLDWGQDLKNLKTYMDQHSIDKVYLSYFGNEHNIAYYQVPAVPLPAEKPSDLESRPPEVYAISATYLQIGNLGDLRAYSWLRQYEPFAKIGYSIFLYRLPEPREGGL